MISGTDILKKRLNDELIRKNQMQEQIVSLNKEIEAQDIRIDMLRSVIKDMGQMNLDISPNGLSFSQANDIPKRKIRDWILGVLEKSPVPLTSNQILNNMVLEGWRTEAKSQKSVVFPEISIMKKHGLIEYIDEEGYRIAQKNNL